MIRKARNARHAPTPDGEIADQAADQVMDQAIDRMLAVHSRVDLPPGAAAIWLARHRAVRDRSRAWLRAWLWAGALAAALLALALAAPWRHHAPAPARMAVTAPAHAPFRLGGESIVPTQLPPDQLAPPAPKANPKAGGH